MSIKDKTCIVGTGLTEYGLRGQLAHLSQMELIKHSLDQALEESGLRGAVIAAVEAAYERAKELGS